MKRTILFLFALSMLHPGMVRGENIDSLPQPKRNARLLELAKATVMKHGPGYYRDVFPPVIVHGWVDCEKTDFPERHYKNDEGRSYYTVEYPYDETQEAMGWYYAALTYIWGDTGVPFKVKFGNGFGFVGLDKPMTRAREAEMVMRFDKRPSRTPRAQ